MLWLAEPYTRMQISSLKVILRTFFFLSASKMAIGNVKSPKRKREKHFSTLVICAASRLQVLARNSQPLTAAVCVTDPADAIEQIISNGPLWHKLMKSPRYASKAHSRENVLRALPTSSTTARTWREHLHPS